jgi:hypothetical protein
MQLIVILSMLVALRVALVVVLAKFQTTSPSL